MEMINPHASKECIIQSLQWCVKMGHCDILQALLMTHFSQTKLSDMAELCSDILIRVVSHGSCDLLNLILPYVDDNFLSNENNKMGKNYLSKMLCHAVKEGNKPVVELLIKKGANVNSFFEGIPLLHVALNAGSSDIAKTLIVSGANVDSALVPAIFASFDDKVIYKPFNLTNNTLQHIQSNFVSSNSDGSNFFLVPSIGSYRIKSKYI